MILPSIVLEGSDSGYCTGSSLFAPIARCHRDLPPGPVAPLTQKGLEERKPVTHDTRYFTPRIIWMLGGQQTTRCPAVSPPPPPHTLAQCYVSHRAVCRAASWLLVRPEAMGTSAAPHSRRFRDRPSFAPPSDPRQRGLGRGTKSTQSHARTVTPLAFASYRLDRTARGWSCCTARAVRYRRACPVSFFPSSEPRRDNSAYRACDP